MPPATKKARLMQPPGSSISRTTPIISSSITTEPGYLSLEAYVSNAFYGVFVQDQDEIAEKIYNRNWSRHVKELYAHLLSILILLFFFSSSSIGYQNPQPAYLTA
jgi:hypothetical protein